MTTIKQPLRSQPTRDRILEAARQTFAKKGYEGTTIRAIAARATINPALVIRYYGSKDALFVAAATLDLKAATLAAVPRRQFGEAVVKHVLDQWDDPEEGVALAAMMRTSASNEAACEHVVAQFAEQLSSLFTSIGPSARAAAPFIAIQILGLTMARYVWRIPTIARLSKSVIVKRVGKTVQSYLDDMTAIVDEKPSPRRALKHESSRTAS